MSRYRDRIHSGTDYCSASDIHAQDGFLKRNRREDLLHLNSELQYAFVPILPKLHKYNHDILQLVESKTLARLHDVAHDPSIGLLQSIPI
jgi:hypothetical protein